MEPESLFCFALADLDACIKSTWHYHTLRIAGLLRLLVLDDSPLTHQVNRAHRLRLRFEHGPGATEEHPDPSREVVHGGLRFAAASLAPMQEVADRLVSSDLNAWLAAGAVRLDGSVLSVREFVQHMAYVRGVVHARQANGPLEEGLIAARHDEHHLVLDFTEPVLDLLRQVGRVTETGLLPLFERAKKSRSPHSGPYPTFKY
jgi:hypothetical protein